MAPDVVFVSGKKPVVPEELVEIAMRADEAGQNVLSVVLLQVVRGWRQAPSTRQCLVNASACMLDAAEAVHRDRRHSPARVVRPELHGSRPNPTT